MQELKEKIEKLILARDTEEAKSLILKYLSREKKSFPAKLECCEWLKRLGLNREAYRLIAPTEWNFNKATQDKEYRTSLFWSARLLNLQGANHYAIQIIEKIKSDDILFHKVAGNIYLSNYEFEKSLHHFKCYFDQLKSKDLNYESKILKVGLADSLEACGEREQAFKILNEIQILPQETYLRGIVHQARAEYLVRDLKLKEAIREIKAAEKLIPKSDGSTDLAFLMKWTAVIEHKLAKTSEEKTRALETFEGALKKLKRPDQRPETWLDCYYLMSLEGLLTPAETTLMKAYPGLPPHFQARIQASPDTPFWVGNSNNPIIVKPHRTEWVYNGKIHLGYPKEIECLEYIARASTAGIPLERLKTLLWPDEFSSFLQLDSRIFQLLRRIEEKFEITHILQNGMIRFETTSLKKIGIELTSSNSKKLNLSFYEFQNEFKLEEFSKYYNLGRTSSLAYLEDEVKNDRLIKLTRLKKVFYKTV